MRSTSIANLEPVGASAAAGRRNAQKIPGVFLLIVVGLFLPEEFSFYIFGLRLTVVRLVFLILTPVLFAKAIKTLSEGGYRFVLSDMLVALAGTWMIYAPANVDGLPIALNHAGPTVLEFCIAYMSSRVLLSEHGHALRFADLLCRGISIVSLLGALDPLTNHYFTHDVAAQLASPIHHSTDFLSSPDAHRLGLLRATGPIEHPILFGFVCTIGLLIAGSTSVSWRSFCVASCAFGVVLAFSTAPIQMMIMGFGLLAYNKLFLSLPYRWSALLIAIAAVIAPIFLMSNNPIGFIISNLIFSPESGYYRVWTWDMVTPHVSQSPWFGLGFGELPDEINHSIDSLWLVLSMQSGYVGAVLVGLSLLAARPISSIRANLTAEEKKLATTLGVVLSLSIYIGFTVHLWGCAWILLGLLLGLKGHLAELAGR